MRFGPVECRSSDSKTPFRILLLKATYDDFTQRYKLLASPSATRNADEDTEGSVLHDGTQYDMQCRPGAGYCAPKKADDPWEAATQEIQEAVLSQDEIFHLLMSLQTQYFKTEDAATKLSVVSHRDVKNMKFRNSEGGHGGL